MGFHREISKGAKFVPRAGEGGTQLGMPSSKRFWTQIGQRTQG